MIVYLVMESGYDFGICRGVFNSKKAANEFKAKYNEFYRFADFIEVERWKIENLAEVRVKWARLNKPKAKSLTAGIHS